MFEKMKANILFRRLLMRRDINKAYKMVGPEDSWYDTITTVHRSLEQMQALPHKILQLKSRDGLTLMARYYPGSSSKTIIWIHGYTSHAERESAFPGLFYRSLGFNVLIPYLRAHGPSQGKYIALGALEHLDIMDWVERVNEMHPQGQILIHGLSMGGGIALDLACKEMKNVKGLVADAPSTDIAGIFRYVAKSLFQKEHQMVSDFALQRFHKEFGVEALAFNRVENIRNCRYPLFLTAGSNENMEDALEQIKQNSPTETTVLILPGCNHGNGMYKQTELYQGALKDFIKQHFDQEQNPSNPNK